VTQADPSLFTATTTPLTTVAKTNSTVCPYADSILSSCDVNSDVEMAAQLLNQAVTSGGAPQGACVRDESVMRRLTLARLAAELAVACSELVHYEQCVFVNLTGTGCYTPYYKCSPISAAYLAQIPSCSALCSSPLNGPSNATVLTPVTAIAVPTVHAAASHHAVAACLLVLSLFLVAS
jgi:hypothetical protein